MPTATGMRCWECGAPTRVDETREQVDGAVRRRRVCTTTPVHRFTTVELTADEYVKLAGKYMAAVPRWNKQKGGYA
jgi:transcriptional regulator NrdR family protein